MSDDENDPSGDDVGDGGGADEDPGPPDEALAPLARALIDAAFVCDAVKVRELLAAGADVDARDGEGRTPLFSAVLGGSAELVVVLLESGADVNAHDGQGFTPLHFCAQENLLEMTRLLIDRGADVNARDEDGSSVLWRAVFSERDRRDVAHALLAAGAKPDVPNRAGESARALANRLGSTLFIAN